MMFQSDYFLMSIVYPIVIPLSRTAMHLGPSQFAAKKMLLLQLQAKLTRPMGRSLSPEGHREGSYHPGLTWRKGNPLRIPVVDTRGRALMPCTPAKARHLFK